MAAEAACSGGGTGSDYNGDGIRDTAIADPEATVEDKARAGQVTVVHGGGKGVTVVSQNSANVADSAEAGDRFGYSLATYDADQDGCDDLVVGTPYEDVGTVRDGGYLQIIYGSTTGIGQGKASKAFVQGADQPLGARPRPGICSVTRWRPERLRPASRTWSSAPRERTVWGVWTSASCTTSVGPPTKWRT